MYFDHIHAPAPMSTTPLIPNFFFFYYKPLDFISTAHMHMGMGPTLRHGQPTRGHVTKRECLSFPQKSSRANISPSKGGASVAPPHMCWNFDWFDLVPVLCK